MTRPYDLVIDQRIPDASALRWCGKRVRTTYPAPSAGSGLLGDVADGWFVVVLYRNGAPEGGALQRPVTTGERLQDKFVFTQDRASAELVCCHLGATGVTVAKACEVRVVDAARRVYTVPTSRIVLYKTLPFSETHAWAAKVVNALGVYCDVLRAHELERQAGHRGAFLKDLTRHRVECFRVLRDAKAGFRALPYDRWWVSLHPIEALLAEIFQRIVERSGQYGYSNVRDKDDALRIWLIDAMDAAAKRLQAVMAQMGPKLRVRPRPPPPPPKPGDIEVARHATPRDGALGSIDRIEHRLVKCRRLLEECESSDLSAASLRRRGVRFGALGHSLIQLARSERRAAPAEDAVPDGACRALAKFFDTVERAGAEFVEFEDILLEEPTEATFKWGYGVIRRAVAAGIKADAALMAG